MEDLLYGWSRCADSRALTGPLPDEASSSASDDPEVPAPAGGARARRRPVRGDKRASGVAWAQRRKGTIVDASIIEAPSSTKNAKRERDPEMHRTKKGNQWHFGMKAHIGVDAETGLAHSLETTPANGSDVATAHAVLHGRGGGVGRRGLPGRRQARREQGRGGGLADGDEARQAPPAGQVGSGGDRREAQGLDPGEVEHPFLYVKRHFGYAKVRYRGLAKNTQRIALLLGFSNLLIAGRYATG